MCKYVLKNISVLATLLFCLSCANRGTPTGGDKDVTPPKIVKSVPENFSTNFKGNEIRIYFDEYVKIKNVQRQLIVSPPMDPAPTVTPTSTASDYIKIIINDTLQPNTTYAFNFGQSIVDNNEENPFSYYKYVFSTGNYIDSLSVKGIIFDAEKRVPETFVSVMLYEVNETYTDSIVYKETPKYITNTLDSITTFSIDNIKAGKYLMVALKEESNNYTFQQKTDKIGFHRKHIVVPSDTIYSLNLFKETPDFKAVKPRQISGQKIAFGYQGSYEDMRIKILENTPEGYQSKLTKDKTTDTLYYWYKPNLPIDSTQFIVSHNTYLDTFKVRFRDMEKDSMVIRNGQSGSVDFNKDFTLEGNTPFEKINIKQITIIDKDSVNVPFKTVLDTLKNTLAFKFDKTEVNSYKIKLLPEALTDFYGDVNDTLEYSFKTKSFSDYGNVRVKLNNAVYPVIVQLTDDKDEVKYEQYATASQPFDFNNITPGKYYLRVVFDRNKNSIWDTGDYLDQKQPERISYSPEFIDVRAGWDWVEEFTLE